MFTGKEPSPRTPRSGKKDKGDKKEKGGSKKDGKSGSPRGTGSKKSKKELEKYNSGERLKVDPQPPIQKRNSKENVIKLDGLQDEQVMRKISFLLPFHFSFIVLILDLLLSVRCWIGMPKYRPTTFPSVSAHRSIRLQFFLNSSAHSNYRRCTKARIRDSRFRFQCEKRGRRRRWGRRIWDNCYQSRR